MIHAYWGDGKGKTSAAFGLALRAAMRGLRVNIVQFLKGTKRYGEVRASAAPNIPNIKIYQFGRPCLHPKRPDCRGCQDCHTDPQNPAEQDILNAHKALNTASKLAEQSDLIVLDEVLYAIAFGLIEEHRLLTLLKNANCEWVLTGNPLSESLRRICDYISHFINRKHHIQKGLVSIIGIDQ